MVTSAAHQQVWAGGRTMGSFRSRRLLPAVAALFLACAGCSISSEDEAVRIPGAQVPFGLSPATTTTTESTESSTTVPNATVAVYFVRDDRLARVGRDAVGSDVAGVLSLLAAGPTEQEGRDGLRTALVPDLATLVEVADSVATVDLTVEFAQLASIEQRLALAQITYSVTQLAGVDQVRFLVGGQVASVPRGDGSTTELPVTPADYADLAPLGG